MKRYLLFLVIPLLVGCEDNVLLRAKQLSVQPASWRGRLGTAATIRFGTDTHTLQGARRVGLTFIRKNSKAPGFSFPSSPNCPNCRTVVTDFNVPIINLESQAVTLFFVNDDLNTFVLSRLPEEINKGALRIFDCGELCHQDNGAYNLESQSAKP